MTIDLGFSHFDADGVRVSLIDVPGHENFIHTMAAGASGVDLALLVVAADDSVMPQTREHLAVLGLLGVRCAAVAITKCDLADSEQLEMVRNDIAELLANESYSPVPIVEVSTINGNGVEALKSAIVTAAQALPQFDHGNRNFRMPIDRAFSLAGRGTIVTGTVWQGSASVGQSLTLLPDGQTVRIRSLESHGIDVESVAAGQRAAMNLTGVKVADVRRGCELATPSAFEPSPRLLVRLKALVGRPTGIRHRQRFRLLLAATQVTAQVLMKDAELTTGEEAFAVLRCKRPVVAQYGQRFILRRLSPAATIGGGHVLLPALRVADRFQRCWRSAEQLTDDDPETRLCGFIELGGETALDEPSLESLIGFTPLQAREAARRLIERTEVVAIETGNGKTGDKGRRLYLSQRRFTDIIERIVDRCRHELERRRPAQFVPLAALLAAASRLASPNVLLAAIERLVTTGRVIRRGDRIRLPAAGPPLSRRQREMLDHYLTVLANAGPTPPTLKEYAEQVHNSINELQPLVQWAADEGLLTQLSDDFAISTDAIERLRLSLVEQLRQAPTVRISDLKERWGMTRKHAVPIFEFMSRRKITVRRGDSHSAGPRLLMPIDEVAL